MAQNSLKRPTLRPIFLRRPIRFKHLWVDALIITVSLYLSLWLRLGPESIAQHIHSLHRFVPVFVILRLATFYYTGVYLAMWRYFSTYDAWRLARAVGLSMLLFFATSYVLPDWGRLPRSFFFIDGLTTLALLTLARLYRRDLYERQFGRRQNKDAALVSTLIYGAGTNGRALAQRLSNDMSGLVQVLGFIDDAPEKQNRVINGFPVLGNQSDLDALIESTGTRQVIIAIQNPSGEFLRNVVSTCRKYNIKPQVINEFGITGEGKRQTHSLYREVELSDLLNRQSTDIDLSSIRDIIRGKRVIVTGAGGSIGSELSRQIFSHQPDKLILCDHSEYNLYEIDHELRLSGDDNSQVIPLLVDIKDESSLRNAFQTFQPELVFHAAAYKHVHLVEANPYPSILNNVYGTLNLLSLSEEFSVERFVLISTDKAVNPAGTMGATKRVCELLTSAVGRKTGKLYCSVRFGNVLGSSGSLIPLLKNQIENGEPVTITHQDMTRYFMLIPEAVSLVLMASVISKPGDINVLKMGEPVKIVDIAKNLIALMGRREDEVPILYTGLRPGEKMFEELYLSGKEIQTKHPDILTVPDGDGVSESLNSKDLALFDSAKKMVTHAKSGNQSAISILLDLVNSNYLSAKNIKNPDLTTS